MSKLIALFFPAFLLLAPLMVQAQYEDHEDLSLDEFREKTDFSYPKDGKTNANGTHTYNNDFLEPEAGHGEGDVVIESDPDLDKMITLSKNADLDEMMEGYRVQVYAGGNLKDANETRADFIEIFSDMPSYRLWVQPTFRIRVGDFANRNAANLFCSEIRKHFPGAFVVPDRFKRPSMRRNRNLQVRDEIPEDPKEDLDDSPGN